MLSYIGMIPNAYPKGIEAADTILDEEYTIEMDDVGSAHITDVLKYDKSWFNSNSSVFEKYPFLLSRRYQDENNLRELENFTSDIDQANYTITLTFDIPGNAYNKGDSWVIYGYADKPKFENQGQLVFESEWTQSDEFTLWNNMHINYTAIVIPPARATNAHYDQNQKAVVYELPYVAAQASSSPLATNKPLFIVLFAILMIASIGGFGFLMAKSKAPAAAVAPFGAGVPGVPEVMAPDPVTTLPGPPVPPPTITPAQVEATQPMPPAPAAAETAVSPDTQEGSRFCKFCGGKLKHAGAKFCSGCGKEQV